MADSTGRERSERWRERRRRGLMPITISVSRDHRRALEHLGLIEPGADRDRDAVAWAVERFLDTAPAVVSIGTALYPFKPTAEDIPELAEEDEAMDEEEDMEAGVSAAEGG